VNGRRLPAATGLLAAAGIAAGVVAALVGDAGGDPAPPRDGAEVPDGGGFAAVSVGVDHVCGLRVGGMAACWGYNDYGQADAPAGEFAAVRVGPWHSCGLRGDRSVVCWGRNDYGQADPPTGDSAGCSWARCTPAGHAPATGR